MPLEIKGENRKRESGTTNIFSGRWRRETEMSFSDLRGRERLAHGSSGEGFSRRSLI